VEVIFGRRRPYSVVVD
jgi:hypothetical protein